MFLPTIYARGSSQSILSLLTVRRQLISNKKNMLNMTDISYKFNPNGNNQFTYKSMEVLFIVNHGGGLPTVLLKPKPLTHNSFSERRLTMETYIKNISNSFSLNLYENNKIILMAVCFAAKKPTFGNDILAVELAKKLRIHVLAADSVVNLSSITVSEYKTLNGKYMSEKKNYIKDISTYGHWYLIDPHGKMQVIQNSK